MNDLDSKLLQKLVTLLRLSPRPTKNDAIINLIINFDWATGVLHSKTKIAANAKFKDIKGVYNVQVKTLLERGFVNDVYKIIPRQTVELWYQHVIRIINENSLMPLCIEQLANLINPETGTVEVAAGGTQTDPERGNLIAYELLAETIQELKTLKAMLKMTNFHVKNLRECQQRINLCRENLDRYEEVHDSADFTQ